MRITTITLAAVGCMVLLGGCNSAESPSEVKKDVANAQQDAAKDVAGENRDAAKTASDSAYQVARVWM